jgi:UDP:flavonoid glycosyltransferase YjiC (YdhE family)
LRILFIGEAVTLAHVVRPVELARHLEEDTPFVVACDRRHKWVVAAHRLPYLELESIEPRQFQRRLDLGLPPYTSC